jgi:vitamin B12 transporter
MTIYNKYLYLLLFVNVHLFHVSTFPQTEKTYKLEDVVVTASRTPLSYNEIPRDVILISSRELNSLPIENMQDVLTYLSGVDLKKRGPEGVQADVSIRGGSFEQTLILINGVKITDPQTGHHNLNLPLNVDDIDHIEILKGQGSKIFGPNAFAGVINFITKKKQEASILLKASGGNFGYYNGSVSTAYPMGGFTNRISLSKNKSDGYRYNTGFDISTFSFSSFTNLPSGDINFLAGLTDKKFGANSFYTASYPGQWEHTKTGFINLNADLAYEGYNFSPKIFFRRNYDDYLLDRNNPDFYHNNHISNSYGVELQAYTKTSIGNFALGGELSKDKIESTNLGYHNRNNAGISAEYNSSPIEDFDVLLGGFLYKYGNFGWHLWPGLDIGYRLSNTIRIYGSVGKSFRIPSFTELFYNSPAQTGNADLQPEEAISYETGATWEENSFEFSCSLFRREGKNLIDWIKTSSTEPWQARNLLKVNTEGFEITFKLRPQKFINDFPVLNINISYTYLSSDKSAGNLQSQYVLDHLKHKLVFIADNYLLFGIRQSWTFRYEDRMNLERYFVADTKLNYNYDWLDVYIEATNLFNKSYNDFSGIPMPGRWIIAGIGLKLEQ